MNSTDEKPYHTLPATQRQGRSSAQALLPQYAGKYDIYPYHSLGPGKITGGYDTLADWISGHPAVMIDGYTGVYWHLVQQYLEEAFLRKGLRVKWLHTADCFRPATVIEEMVSPFLGAPNALWGKKTSLSLADFFEPGALASLEPDTSCDISIIIGTGAALAGWDAPIIYLDLPKNELQYRMRAGSTTNLGKSRPEPPARMYKRYYFVDWVVLNQHKQHILSRLSLIADAQWPDAIHWMKGADLQQGLSNLARSVFRVRPWFEPGAWGGQWMKEHIPALNKTEVNYAWSFEMIVPENGLVFESNGLLLEVSFDLLMFSEHQAVLGRHAGRFGTEFPIRFDFLDTYEGGNLSIQCHPSLPYIREQFGENITQDETYYILDCQEQAKVYLGFHENIDAGKLRDELENSRANGVPVDIDQYVQSFPAKKHDLFLIPNGTVHSAGAGNLVLEISATPYIFTFKMYDWLRLDLNGQPRSITLEHAFNNLNFSRKGDRVQEELISKPAVIEKGADWQLLHLPTHPEHFYDVHRLEFLTEVTQHTGDSCHVLMLVEGTSVTVRTAAGATATYHYAETFAIPAAAESYTLINQSGLTAKVVKAFLRD
jgi:mannose-6-phosphate isomerase class I